ncbi:hypothetical protein [Streptococcus equinus]|uniref:hypothetical protein n=1 Tax=Streptococcus equinus TaxID=1335 RepID=UPI003BF8785D
MSNIVQKKNKGPLSYTLLYLTILVNVLIPKSGIKLGNIPITLGNVFFVLTLIFWFFGKLGGKKIVFDKKIGGVIFLSIIYALLKYLIIGSFKEHIGYVIPLVAYPLIYFIIVDLIDSEEKFLKIFNLVTICIFSISLYALLQFVVGIDKCTIPGITVNYSDYIKYGKYWFMTKANGLSVSDTKIVSTYQNGNLFGVNMILFFPWVYYGLKVKHKTKLQYISLVLFLSSVFLSLSRSCWLGLIIFIIFCILLDEDSNKADFLKKFFIVLLTMVIIMVIFQVAPSVFNRFSDTSASDWVNMSGRSDGFINTITSVANSDSVLAWFVGPEGVIDWNGLAYEMLPLAIFVQLGIIGVCILYYCFIKSLYCCRNYIKSDMVKGMYYGLLIWLIVGLIEAGYWLPPGALNVFIIIGLMSSYRNILQGEIQRI